MLNLLVLCFLISSLLHFADLVLYIKFICCQGLLLFYHFILVLLIYFQQILSTSNENTHHTMIGMCLLSAS
jgi:hypothetical protein